MSAQLSALEAELGLPVFERRRPRLGLTPAGENLYRLAAPLVQGMDRLPDTFAEGCHGVARDVLRIGAGQISAAYLLPRYLTRFRELNPDVPIVVMSGQGRTRLQWLRAYELDLVVAAVDIPPPDMEFHPLLTSRPMLITALDHPLAGRDAITVKEAAGYPFVGSAPTHYVRHIIETILRQHGIAIDVVVEVDGWGAIVNYVARGVGVSIVPDLCLTEHERVWRTPVKELVPPRIYGAITRRDGLLTLAAKRLLHLMAGDATETCVRS